MADYWWHYCQGARDTGRELGTRQGRLQPYNTCTAADVLHGLLMLIASLQIDDIDRRSCNRSCSDVDAAAVVAAGDDVVRWVNSLIDRWEALTDQRVTFGRKISSAPLVLQCVI